MSKSYRTTEYETFEFYDEDNEVSWSVEVAVDIFVQEPFNGSPYNCDSELDYYGYQEIEEYAIEAITAYNDDGDEVPDVSEPSWLNDEINKAIYRHEFQVSEPCYL